MAALTVTGPSTVGRLGSRSPARVTCVAAGMIIGKISEMSGKNEAMIDNKIPASKKRQTETRRAFFTSSNVKVSPRL